jgi:pSer/pThr/pTyr-binding forkhead associated (FHA) protein/RNA polymerase subunit RPABC4/transcription elongation factor Spt4
MLWSSDRDEVGLVCGGCDTFCRRDAKFCPTCGKELVLRPADPSSPAHTQPSFSAPPKFVSHSLPFEAKSDGRKVAQSGGGAAEHSEEKPMDQARYYVCESCMTPVPSGHKFCGRCGAGVPDTMLHQPVEFYSDMQDPSKARLILIRGEGMDGLSYHLKADQHIVGRAGQVEFPDDPFVSPKHANFFYRDDRLVVRDEGSLNGVYYRIRGAVEIAPGDTFLAGEQLFRLDPTPKASDGADADGTYFYSSPKYPSAFRLNQILEGGAVGMTVCTRGASIQIGREDGDLNFPADLFMSARHCTVEEREGRYHLTDLDSRNGTYIRIKTERALNHGDYVFIGRRLLRVEMNSN